MLVTQTEAMILNPGCAHTMKQLFHGVCSGQ
jgi:hypothetical protein